MFAALFFIVFLMPFYLVHPRGLPIASVGYIMVTPFIFLFFISPVSGSLSDKIGSRMLCTGGMLLMMCAVYFLSTLPADASIISILWRLALVGVGAAIFMPPNSALAMSITPPDRRGIAGGTIATVRNLGMVLGVALAGLVFNSTFFSRSNGELFLSYTRDIEPIFMASFQTALMAGALIAGIGVGVAFMRGNDKKK
jgi:MFS family permease